MGREFSVRGKSLRDKRITHGSLRTVACVSLRAVCSMALNSVRACVLDGVLHAQSSQLKIIGRTRVTLQPCVCLVVPLACCFANFLAHSFLAFRGNNPRHYAPGRKISPSCPDAFTRETGFNLRNESLMARRLATSATRKSAAGNDVRSFLDHLSVSLSLFFSFPDIGLSTSSVSNPFRRVNRFPTNEFAPTIYCGCFARVELPYLPSPFFIFAAQRPRGYLIKRSVAIDTPVCDLITTNRALIRNECVT